MCGLREQVFLYIKDRQEIPKNKHWETGVDCLERAMGILLLTLDRKS